MSESAHQLVPLKQLNIYLSDGCSLSCRHCWLHPHSPPKGQEPQFLSVVFFMQAIREALPMGLRTVVLTGAESLRHPHFDTLFDWVDKLSLNIVVETGGDGLTVDRALRLARSTKISVTVGLDGVDAETHDNLHHEPGSFQVATQAIQTLASAGLPPQITFSVLRHNAYQIGPFVRLAEELGASSVRFSVPQRAGNTCEGYKPSQVPISPEITDELQVPELIAIGRRVDRELACSTRLMLSFDQPPAFRGLHTNGYIDGRGRCGILNSLGVLSNGRYALCGAGQNADELILGKVGADPLDQLWTRQPILTNLRDGMPERLQGICERCIMKTACLGNCTAENYLRTGSFWGPYWYCDAAEQSGLFPAGRLIENNW